MQQWLKAGFIENKQLFPTEQGTPQGGIISPTIANMTLDGLENMLDKAFGISIRPDGCRKNKLLMRPSKDSIKSVKSKLKEIKKLFCSECSPFSKSDAISSLPEVSILSTPLGMFIFARESCAGF